MAETNDIDSFLNGVAGQDRGAFDIDAFLGEVSEAAKAAPTTPPVRDERATSVATAPQTAAATMAERRRAAKEEMDRGRFADAVDAAKYGFARGAVPGIDRFVGIGTDLGDAAASLVHGLPAPEVDTAQKAREEYLRDEEMARSGSPAAFIGGEIAGAVPMTVAAAGGGSPLLRGPASLPMATRPIPAAASVVNRAGQIANTPGTRLAGQNFVAGAANSRSDDPREQARAGVVSAAAGEVAGAAGKKVGKFLGESMSREYRGLMKDIMQNADTEISAIPTVRRRFMNRADAAVSEVKADNVLQNTIREGDAAGASRIAESKLQVISHPRAGLYRELDSHGVLGIDQLDAAIMRAERRAIGGEKAALEEFRRELNEDWIPKWKEEGNLVQRPGRPLGVTGLGVREWVSRAQKGAQKTLGTINETEHADIKGKLEDVAEEIWDNHLRAASREDPALVRNIREYDRRASGLLALKSVMDNRARRDAEGLMGWGKKHEGKIDALVTSGAGMGALAGHPAEAAAGFAAYQAMKRIPAAASKINDAILVPLQRAAMAGKPWAEVANAAATTGVPQGMARAIFDAAQRARGQQSTETSTAVR